MNGNKYQNWSILAFDKNAIIFLSFLFLGFQLYAQEKVPIQKSSEIRSIGGKSFYIHYVVKGHTLYSISRVYDVSVDKIYFENPEAKQGLKIGQTLKIPIDKKETVEKVSEAPDKLKENVVSKEEPIKIPVDQKKAEEKVNETQEKPKENAVNKKENLKIPVDQKKADVKVSAIEEKPKENVVNRKKIRKTSVNQNKKKKRVNETSEKSIVHVVKRKENLYRISKKYKKTINEIKALNPGLTKNLKIGQTIIISVGPKREKPKKIVKTKTGKIAVPIIVGDGDLKVKLFDSKRIQLTPGSTSNIIIMLINDSDALSEFHLKITTPEGWSHLTDYSSVFVEKESKKFKIFSFYILESTEVGDYTIDIEAFDKTKNVKIGTINIPVYVKPRYEILTGFMNAPDYVFSGDTFNVKFMIRNLSNVETNIRADILNINVSETRILSIPADSTIEIPIFITTEKDIVHYTRNCVSLTASIIENPEIESDVAYIFDVIPAGKVDFDAYNRIPVRISGLFVTDNQLGDRKYGGMFDIKGSGVLSKSKLRAIDFHFRGPNRQGNPLFGQTDEYYVKYFSPRSKAVVGDNIYSLTDLTEGSRNGRGVEYEHKFKKIGVGSFINYPRFYPEIERVISVFGSYFSDEKFQVNIGYLNKTYVTDSAAQLFTLSGEANPFSWAYIDLEYATGMAGGKTTMAYSAALNIKISRYRFFLKYKMAGKDFPGYLTDSRFINTGLSAIIFRKISLNLNYNLRHTNVALDTMYANAPFSDNVNFSLGYQLNFNHSISIGLNMRGREDRSMPKQFNYKEYTARISFQSRINRFGVNLYGAYGKINNLLEKKVGETENILNGNLSLQYKMSDHISVKGFVSYQGGQQYIVDDFTKLYYGCVIHANWNNKATIIFQYQNNYEVDEYYRDRSILALDANYLINKNNEFGVTVDYNLRKNSLNNTQLSASFNYTYILKVPVSKREDIGSLYGKVINNGVNNIEGILFTLAGNISVSDENGEFEFPVLKTGTHFLFMDNSKSGLNSIAEIPGPYKIEVFPGEKYNFEVTLTKSGKISGILVIEEDENKGKKGYIPVKEEVKNLIIEVSNGNEVYRVFTDKDGTFDFEDLRPGKWTVKIYDRGIPKGYLLENDEFNIDLISEQIKIINVIIKKKSRKIKFQKK